MVDDFARRMQTRVLPGAVHAVHRHDRLDNAEQMKPEALKRIQNRLVLEAVAKAENIEISDEKVDEEMLKMAECIQDGS